MTKKLAIVPYATNGINSQVGQDGHFNIFKKKRSTVIKEKIEKALSLENIDIDVIIDTNHGDLHYLKRQGVDLFIIPEMIYGYIDYSDIDKSCCFKLTNDEYDNGDIKRVIDYIKEML